MRTFSLLLNSTSPLAMMAADTGTGSGAPAGETDQDDEPTLAELLAEGQSMVKDGTIKLDDMRAHYRIAFKRDTKLSDDQIIMVVMTTEDDQSPEDWAKLMEVAEANKPKHEDDKQLEAKRDNIYAMADKLDANAELQSHGDETVKAPEKTKRGAAVICVDMLNDPEFDMDALPRPGSVKVPGSNQPYDLYTRTAQDGTEIEGSYFTDLASRTKIGRAALDMVAAYTAARDKTEGYDKKLAELAPTKVDSEIAKHGQRFKRWVGLLSQAATIYYNMADIQDKMPGVVAAFQYDDMPEDANPETYKPVLFDTVKCMYIQAKSNPANIKALYPSEFIRLNVDAAIKAGGKWSDLLATAKRKKGARGKNKATPATAATEANKGLLTVADFKDWALRGANLVDWESPEGREHMAALGNAMVKWSDDDIRTFGTLIAGLDVVWVKSGADKRFETLQGKPINLAPDGQAKRSA